MAGSKARTAARLLLGGALVFAGISHLTFARKDFQAQVPEWVPVDEDTTVLASGVVEIALGAALASGVKRNLVGNVAAAFFTAIFPGNLSQWINRRDAFGLDTDSRRFTRLFFQPVLIAWALWSTRR
ncbi:DoxX family membrane protein [Plantibacter sp. ME-Dv--P-095]|uniref:DoxX family protein n=1 Tax=Plantibacter sp. ME-Dv--P-095 TaxID=3040299 RepID=UPI002549DE5C|nr:DoxX family membrane protein [Plantibacter sp. ME-Dv--P-095]